MKKTKLFILMLLITNCICSQNLNNRFDGAVTRDGSIQLLSFNFYVENGVQKGTYEIPDIGMYDVPLDEIKVKNDTLNLRFYYGNMFCFLNDKKEEITGVSENWQPKIRIHVKKVRQQKKPYTRENIKFSNGNIELSGMIYHPKNNSNNTTKYVVLVHGSGRQNRYAPYYISLGYNLSKRGIGVLLYDKRGTGKSTGNYEKASMEDLANDASAAYNFLRNHLKKTGKISDGIGFLGTSQGGWIAPIAANKNKDCDFLVLNVGPSSSVFKQDIHRVKYSMESNGWDKKAIDSALVFTKLYFEFAESNNSLLWSKLEKLSEEIKNKEWAEYVNIPVDENDFTWWRLNNYDPRETLTSIECKTLSIFAEYDRLVPPRENEDKMRKYLTQAGVDFDIKTIKGTYHNMQSGQGLNGNNWDWPQVYWQWRKQPNEFIDSIVEFIAKNN